METKDIDYGVLAQQKAEEHLQSLAEWLDDELWDPDYRPPPEEEEKAEPFGPYCGCTTCVVREVLFVGWPFAQHDLLDQLEQLIIDGVEGEALLRRLRSGIPTKLV